MLYIHISKETYSQRIRLIRKITERAQIESFAIFVVHSDCYKEMNVTIS